MLALLSTWARALSVLSTKVLGSLGWEIARSFLGQAALELALKTRSF
jgi:hypothetical protein